jgi:hypothetical protein
MTELIVYGVEYRTALASRQHCQMLLGLGRIFNLVSHGNCTFTFGKSILAKAGAEYAP